MSQASSGASATAKGVGPITEVGVRRPRYRALFRDQAALGSLVASFFNFRSSLFGLHLVQDLPSLCAATQHLWRQSLPFAAASWQQVCLLVPFPSGAAEAVSKPMEQPKATKTFVNFIITFSTASCFGAKATLAIILGNRC